MDTKSCKSETYFEVYENSPPSSEVKCVSADRSVVSCGSWLRSLTWPWSLPATGRCHWICECAPRAWNIRKLAIQICHSPIQWTNGTHTHTHSAQPHNHTNDTFQNPVIWNDQAACPQFRCVNYSQNIACYVCVCAVAGPGSIMLQVNASRFFTIDTAIRALSPRHWIDY